jgi:hypothetical protein
LIDLTVEAAKRLIDLMDTAQKHKVFHAMQVTCAICYSEVFGYSLGAHVLVGVVGVVAPIAFSLS